MFCQLCFAPVKTVSGQTLFWLLDHFCYGNIFLRHFDYDSRACFLFCNYCASGLFDSQLHCTVLQLFWSHSPFKCVNLTSWSHPCCYNNSMSYLTINIRFWFLFFICIARKKRKFLCKHSCNTYKPTIEI